MRIIHTDSITPGSSTLDEQEKDWVYNGMDCAITAEVFDVLHPQLDNHTAATYTFSKDLQGPILEMRLRGILVDQARKEDVIEDYFTSLDQLENQLEKIVGDGCGFWGFNWRSNSDLKHLFYNLLGIPTVIKKGSETVNRDALEKLENYFQAVQIVSHIKTMRDLQKKISMLKTEIDPDGRMRTSFNIAGTTTGRLSSSFSEFGTGTNLQNIEEALRSVFIADPGYKLAYIDAEQGESRVVGAIEWNLFLDGRYLDTCESGDLHTRVAKLCWPSLPWPGDPAGDRKLAERPYYRHYDRRFMCKKIGHGTNYGGKPDTLANQAKVEVGVIKEFQPIYFKAFPAHLRWHENVDRRLREDGYLVSLTGRKRYFFGRRNDAATLREAIAYDPQGSLADILDRGMLNVWRHRQCQLLLQIHDAILIQYPEKEEEQIISMVLQQLRYPIQLDKKREFVIPYGVNTGWNWGKISDDNPEGLKPYVAGDTRRRSKTVHLLDRIRGRLKKPS